MYRRAGWRIDYFLASESLKGRLRAGAEREGGRVDDFLASEILTGGLRAAAFYTAAFTVRAAL